MTAADAYLAPLTIDFPRVSKLAIDLSHIYRHLALNSKEQFLATPINVLPKGTEVGHFLAVEVGGSNLRIAFIELLGSKSKDGNIRRTHEQAWPIDDHIKMDRPEELFSWIGSCIASVVVEHLAHAPDTRPSDEPIPLGITFSFPMIQPSINEATLMPMGKGFAITSELNLGKMLLRGYARHVRDKHFLHRSGLRQHVTDAQLPDIKIEAITNDTVATLSCLAYSVFATSERRVAMGLIVGTGTNSSIAMKLSDLHEDKRASIILPAKTNMSETEVVVNTEWTIKGAAPPLHAAGLITSWDEELDRDCEAPGFQPFEYMTAGRYLGELCRLIVRNYLVDVEHVSVAYLPRALCCRNALPTILLSEVAARKIGPTELLPELKRHFPAPMPNHWQWTEASSSLFLKSSRALQLRSAKMIAAATVGLLASAGDLTWKRRQDQSGLAEPKSPCEELVVAFAGGVITSFPGFFDTYRETIDQLVNDLTDTARVQRVVLRDANNGGLVGAGVLAGTVWSLP